MTQNKPSRRSFLKSVGIGSAALVGSTMLHTSQTMAQSNPSLAQEAAFYRFKVGDFDVTVVNDGVFHFPAPAFGTNAPEGAVSDLLTSKYLPADVVTAPIQIMLVDTGDHKVLIDTGMGASVMPGDTPNSGKLLSTLALMGVQAEDIDTVLITHGHPDHLGGVITDDAPSFPNARYLITQIDWDFWTGIEPNTDDGFFNFMLSTAQNNLSIIDSQLERFDAGLEVVPGITTVSAPGHTLGHVAVMIESGDDKLFNLVDTAVHYVVALEQPGWYLAAEVDPEQAEKTRRQLLSMASDERLKIFGYHFPFPGIGYVIHDEDNDRYDFLPTG